MLILGVVLKPFEGAKKGGVKGFLKGTWQGVSGLVFKPVTGVLDAASKTSEGIKNTATYYDDKPNQTRQRYPRSFYGKEKFYRTYLVTDAEVSYLLQICNEGQFANISLLYTFDIFPNEKEREDYYVLVLSIEKVLYFSAKRAEVVWDFPSIDIDKVTQTTSAIHIYLKNTPKSLNVILFYQLIRVHSNIFSPQ